MEASFWLTRWQRREIGFHGSAPHPLLVKHFASLALPPAARVFVPLCGKTLDIGWLLSQGYRVVGAELSEVAIQELFQELAVTPTVTPLGSLSHYAAPGLDIFVGDIFDLTREQLGAVDMIYDRAALVALPPAMRSRYAEHLQNLTDHAAQLLICFVYDDTAVQGPPFSIPEVEVRSHYEAAYELQLLEQCLLPAGFRGRAESYEYVWYLQPHGAV